MSVAIFQPAGVLIHSRIIRNGFGTGLLTVVGDDGDLYRDIRFGDIARQTNRLLSRIVRVDPERTSPEASTSSV
jgi:hypothetical protein